MTDAIRARYYHPQTAQFLSRDPIEPITRKPYTYGASSPLNFIDPTGLGECKASGQAGEPSGNPEVETEPEDPEGEEQVAERQPGAKNTKPKQSKKFSEQEIEGATETLTEAEKQAVRNKQAGQRYDEALFASARGKLNKSGEGRGHEE